MKTADKSFPFKQQTFTVTISNLQFTEILKLNSIHGREALQQCAWATPPDQSNNLIPGARTHKPHKPALLSERKRHCGKSLIG